MLRLAHGDAGASRTARKWFCSRCGSEPRSPSGGGEPGRVCAACGMGVLLSCTSEAEVAPGSAFLVVGEDLCVSAVSEAAEAIFGPEEEILFTRFDSLVWSSAGVDRLATAIVHAARGARGTMSVPVRPGRSAAGGDPLHARIASCGPPRAALVVLAPGAADG